MQSYKATQAWLIGIMLLPTAAIMAAATEEITVTSHRVGAYALPTTSISILKRQDILQSGKSNLEQVLRLVPGLDVVRTGGFGGQTSIFTRGSESDHTLVLLDGVPINDPRTGAVDIAFIDIANVERIEVIRGPQATLHGALGGVIHIIRKTASTATADLRLDSKGYRLGMGGSHGILGQSGWSVYGNALKHYTEGISAADNGSERDSLATRQFSTGISKRDGDMLFRADFNWLDSQSDIDDYTSTAVDDPDYRRQRKQWQGTLLLQKNTDTLTQQLRLTHQDITDSFSNGPLAMDSFSDNTSSTFTGTESIALYNLVRQQQLANIDAARLSAGIELRHAKGKAATLDKSTFSQAVWLQQDLDARVVAISAGGRLQQHPDYGSHGNLNLALTVPLDAFITDSLISASYGSGYRSPSINELFSPGFGNRDLQPEQNKGITVAWSYQAAQTKLSVEHYSTRLKNRIDYDFASMRLINSGRADISGMELAINRSFIGQDLAIDFNASRTNAENSSTGQKLLRRAKYKWQLAMNKGMDKLNLSISIRYTGNRPDIGGTLPSHILTDANLIWQHSPQLSSSLRLDNIFNRNYQEVRGYGTPGREIFISGKWQLGK